jgi:hypothetical protein
VAGVQKFAQIFIFPLFLRLLLGEKLPLSGMQPRLKRLRISMDRISDSPARRRCEFGPVFQWIEFEIPILKM